MNFPGPLTQLGRYQLNSVLGRGAMGLVYEAHDPRLGRKVAVKTILKSHLLDDALGREYSARFVREAQAAARLNHPHIVTVFDFGEEDEVAYIVMEFIEGRELAQHFDDNHFFDRPTAVRILCELLDALAYAHDRGIVHRDIKPANVMIDQQGRVKLTDFGVARLADSNADRTLPGTMVGTPSYMSPEQIQGQAVGSRTDLFAAGVILYQFLTHQKPFTGGGQWTIQRKIVNDDPLPPSFANKDVPPVFDAIVKRALAKNPDQRYQTAAEFADDLRRALAERPSHDPEATVMMPQPAPSARVRHAATTLPPVTRPPVSLAPASEPAPMANVAPAPAPGAASRGPGWPWFAGLGTVGALAAVLMWWWPSVPTPVQGPGVTSPPTPASEAAAPPAPVAVPVTAQQPAQQLAPPVTTESNRPAPKIATAAPRHSAASQAVPSPQAGVALPRTRPATTSAGEPGSTVRPDSRATSAGSGRPDSARCAELLQRLQLGEDLSPENLTIFQKECKR